MSDPDDPRILPSPWMRWAEQDLTAARHAAADSEVVPRVACTWAHQAAEKALKALLVAGGTDPARTHDLTRLSGPLDAGLRGRLDAMDLVELTRWSIEGRYPDEFDEASEKDAERALLAAQSILLLAAEHLATGAGLGES
jgi:HEPN domain-containing protein